MKKAHVDSVTVFAKCHHGHLYYETKRAREAPWAEARLGLLEGQVEALHREGIRAPIYISIMCDEYAGQRRIRVGVPQRRRAARRAAAAGK